MPILYFTYGSLKKGFPNHQDHPEALSDFVGTAVTSEAMPLLVPNEPNCTNPNCRWLHRMPTLVDMPGKGRHVKGEVYRLRESDIKALDALEGFISPGNPGNVYERKAIPVSMDGQVMNVEAYVIADPSLKLEEWKQGKSAAYEEYTQDMSSQDLKPGYQEE